MTDKNKQFAERSIHHLVWSGFYSAPAVQEIIEYQLEQEEVDREWIEARIAQEVARKADDEKTWPAETDCDQLNRVFGVLNDSGIIALQNAGYTQSDGLDDVTEVYHDLGAAESGMEGYCFYHGQDLERAVQGHGVMLAFGDVDGAHDKGVEIGRRIVAALEAEGFQVEWPGTVAQRINVPQIKWQRRSPRV